MGFFLKKMAINNGNNVKSIIKAKINVKLTSKPVKKVPPNEDKISVKNPAERMMLVTIIAFPVLK